jgi:hypothetical protein
MTHSSSPLAHEKFIVNRKFKKMIKHGKKLTTSESEKVERSGDKKVF